MYIRTKYTVLEKEKTNIGKQYKLDIINKDNGSIIDTIICDYVEDESVIFDIIYAEYLITHHLDARNYNRKLEIIDNSLIIKQADTIEELCDEFLCYGDLENKRFHIADTYSEAKNVAKAIGYKNICACIWIIDNNDIPTLKPVAKMNEKGELELL